MVRIIIALLVSAVMAGSVSAKTVTDVLGRQVDVPDNVERIVALGSSMTFVTYLGAQDIVAGVEDFDKRKGFTKPYIYVNSQRVKDLPVVAKGGPGRSVNIEAVISVRPDVIFLNTLDRSEPDKLQRKLRIPVVAVSYGLPAFELETFYKSIKVAGEVLGRGERASEVINFFSSRINELASVETSGKSAYIGGISFKGFHGIDSSSGGFFPFELANIKNIADSAGRKGQLFLSREFVLNADPSLIFIDGNGLKIIKEDFEKNSGFYKRLSAFRDGNVHLCLPDTSYFVNPDVMLANAFAMSKAAYPEKYGYVNPEQKADEIFSFLYGEPVYKHLERDAGGYRQVRISEGELVFEKYHDH